MPKWRKDSIFGDGPRQPLDRNGRARFKFLARAHRGAGRLTADHLEVAEVLLGALGDDGRLDLAHDTIAERALCITLVARGYLYQSHGSGRRLGCSSAKASRCQPLNGLTHGAGFVTRAGFSGVRVGFRPRLRGNK